MIADNLDRLLRDLRAEAHRPIPPAVPVGDRGPAAGHVRLAQLNAEVTAYNREHRESARLRASRPERT